MPNRRLPKRKIKEVLRLRVGNYLRRAVAAGLKWPLEEELSDTELEMRLFPVITTPLEKRPLPDCEEIHKQLRDYKRVNLTLTQLWMEYRKDHPDGYQYTQFCEYYHRWRGKQGYSMSQVHRAGEKLFVHYGGNPVLVDQETGELIPTQLFVAVWCASNYTYAEASLSQSLPDWTGSHARAFTYFGCVPRMVTQCYVPRHIIGAHHLGNPAKFLKGVFMGRQEVALVLLPDRFLIAVTGARKRHAEDPGAPIKPATRLEGRRPLEEVHLGLFARRMLHHLDIAVSQSHQSGE